MKKLNIVFQTHSDSLNAKNLATMEMYAMDTLYVVNEERENKPFHHWLQIRQQMSQLRWRPSILYQNMPSLEKRKRNLNYKIHQKNSLSRSQKNSWRLHKNKNYSQISQNNPKSESKKRRKLPKTNLQTTPTRTSRLAKIHTRNKIHTVKFSPPTVQTLNQWLNITWKKHHNPS